MKKEEQTYIRISQILFLASIILILFSFLSPILFTSSFSNWDFTETGQIGDTIGGIMNPFIAIAGVISTFLAFFMQIEANKIQRTQFIKSLNNKFIDDKIDSYYKLSLIKIDIDNTIKDIDTRVQRIDEYIAQIKENPYNLAKLYRSTLKQYDRVASMERLSIYKGFKEFLRPNENWLVLFNRLYSILDYIPEAFKEEHRIIDNHNKDIFKDKNKIRNIAFSFEKICTRLLNEAKHQKNYSSEKNIHILLLYNKYKEIVNQSHGETDFLRLKEIFDRFNSKAIEYIRKGNEDPYLGKLQNTVAEILVQFNSIDQKSEQLIFELEQFKNGIGMNENSIKYKLQEISSAINDAIQQTTIEKIQKEYFS
ncbi:hypothetical protein [Bacteroides fragilis]|uniref:hypothetical protein n=1 Tax=Bacteroides fragilis TaxID=817 RepID=UPI0002808ECD|nr:hypothetical protein [Bacteroides fragilis]EKA87698.1 hypothetical protein HMPREF1203_04623 [Bacteroides fragilis HMW 610]